MGSQTFRTSPTFRTCLTRPRANTDSCSFAPFVLLRGLKIVNRIPTFPLPRGSSIHARKGESEQFRLPVRGLPYCVSQHNKAVGRQHKEAS